MFPIAILGAAGSVSSAVNQVAGLFGGDNKDATERLPRNQFAYNLALTQKNQAAADFLAGRAGLFGAAGHQVAGFGDKDTPGMIGGWATSTAVTDALNKYKALQAAGIIDANGKIVAAVGGSVGAITTTLGKLLGLTPAATPATTTASTVVAPGGLGMLTPVLLIGTGFLVYWFGFRKR